MSQKSSDPEFPLDEWLERIKLCKYLKEDQMKKLCILVYNKKISGRNHISHFTSVKTYLMDEPNVVNVSPPVTVCGDIHGQFWDLMELFKQGGEMPLTNYLFLGDYVDRGYHSLETLTLLLLLKARFPNKINLLRGNHETRSISQTYGFYDEVVQKYGTSRVWQYCCEVFDYLNIGATIDGRIFCVHGGISGALLTLDDLQTILRNKEIPKDGPFTDLVWSDPDESIDQFAPSARGAGYLFGAGAARDFLHNNGFTLIVRSHQLVNEGYKYIFPKETTVTVWSAPNYCYRCGNVAAIMHVDTHYQTTFTVFSEVKEKYRKTKAKTIPDYFL